MTENADIPDVHIPPDEQAEQGIGPSEQSVTPAPTRRRRRRGTVGQLSSQADADAATEDGTIEKPTGARRQGPRGPLLRPRRWLQRFPTSWGPSPTYRVLIFLSAIVLVMAFLIYSEYVINELRDREHDRVELYAHLRALVSSSADIPPQLEQWVLEHVVVHPEEKFPIVVTDHRGDIELWAGPGLPNPNDRSVAALRSVREVVGRMDAEREPIRFFDREQAFGLVWLHVGDMVIANNDRDIVTWGGPSLPASDDTSAAALDLVLRRLPTMGRPDSIRVPAADSSYCYWGRSSYVIADGDSKPIVWGGPAFTEGSGRHQVLLEMQRLARVAEPRKFRIPTERIYHYGDSNLVSRIEFAPFITLGVLLLFSVIGYIGFRNIRRSEQRSIWVGMAKETAHQLGTPLSSLSGWLELMAAKQAQGEGKASDDGMDIADIAREMQQDLERLNQIASRFSQIGSVPELRMTDVRALLDETIGYFQSRGPQFGQHRIDFHTADVPHIPLNAELMGWAFENLFKNAIDAIGRQNGLISVALDVVEADETVKITITDNGRGIRPEHQTRVFEPGFSTKKRGWGLGLAFVKRIVEDYHGGRIQVVESAEDKGTSFEIVLPMQDSEGSPGG